MRIQLFSKNADNSKKPKVPIQPAANLPSTSSPSTSALPNANSLPPKFSVPPVLHPTPFKSIEISVAPDGVIVHPVAEGKNKPPSGIIIRWGVRGAIDEVALDENLIPGPTVFGILGILRLFQSSYLLVITAKTDVGNLFENSHSVYRIQGVMAIPLSDEDRASKAVKSIAARQAGSLRKGKMTPTVPQDDVQTPQFEDGFLAGEQSQSVHVKFTEGNKATTADQPASQPLFSAEEDNESISSDSTYTETGSPSRPSSPISKGLASRLSFWKKQSRNPEAASQTSASSRTSFSETPPLSSSSTLPSFQSLHIQDEPGPKSQADAVKLGNSLNEKTAPPAIAKKRSELEEKIVRETMREFSRGQMFFSYDFDITHSLQRKYQAVVSQQKHNDLLSNLDPEHNDVSLNEAGIPVLAEPHPTLPLWRRVDRKFWWNEHLSTPLMDAGAHSYILPVMQGYVQLSTLQVPRSMSSPIGTPGSSTLSEASTINAYETLHYALISRRARTRAGLRYQRRGIDDEGFTANFVETETIMQTKREGVWNVFSHVQIRGSIPLFWSQPGSSLKPPPVLDRPVDKTLDVTRKHFDRTIKVYGPHTIVNLSEQQGREAAVTLGYGEAMKKLKHSQAKYNDFDFHRECAGMRYENISKLVDQLAKTFESQGFFWVSGSTVLAQQHGVFRINCIDCLDRTNVVMSAFARHVLNTQLEAVAIVPSQGSPRSELDRVFNDVWANNGDAISRAYAGTSALKGDFTRTGKRDLGGMLNDGMNSVMRMYTSSFSDYFSQACIDYFLGHRTTSVFSEFLLKLSSTDPREMHRLSKIRAAAIETSASLVIYSGEQMLSGWTLISPMEFNVRAGVQFGEKVLLLTNRALYIVHYDYEMEKVKMYTRIALVDISVVEKGVYILSSLDEGSRNPEENYGFLLSFRPRKDSIRITSYAHQNQPSDFDPTLGPLADEPEEMSSLGESPGLTKTSSVISNALSMSSIASFTSQREAFATFKALPPDLHRDRQALGTDDSDDITHSGTSSETCEKVVNGIVEAIRQASISAGYTKARTPGFVQEKDIVSLAEAQRLASVYSRFEYALKRLLWLGST